MTIGSLRTISKGKGFRYVENDKLFQDLAQRLDDCSNLRGGCDGCPLLADCCKFFDWMSDRASDKTLKAEDQVWFESQYQKLFKQIPMFTEIAL